ncbi:MAG: hypothetical protein ACKESC_00205 [Candidatus Hodgkinia cicadicola]
MIHNITVVSISDKDVLKALAACSQANANVYLNVINSNLHKYID